MRLHRRLAGFLLVVAVLAIGLALRPTTSRAAAPLQLSVGQGSIDNTVYYVDWTSANAAAGTASGVINLPGGHTVNVNFAAVFGNGSAGSFAFGQTGCGTNYWSPTTPYVSPEVPNPPPPCELLALVGGANQIYRLTLSEPIRDPLMAIVSLGNSGLYTQYDFDSPFTIVSQGAGFWGGTSTSLQQLPGDILQGNEGHGTIRFLGSFNTFSWVVPTGENWHGFTFGIRTTAALAAPVTVDEGQVATNNGSWSGDNVTLSASAGTVVKNPAGTWNWSMPTSDGPVQSQNITITATDAFGSISRNFSLKVNNVAPTGLLNNNGPVSTGAPLTASFTGQSDPSGPDMGAGLRYAFSCNGAPLGAAAYATSSPNPSVQCAYPTAGPVTIRGKIMDKDGGATEYLTSTDVLSLPCQPGTYNALTGAQPCTPAEPGTFVPGPGAFAPIPCAPGFYQPNFGATSCMPAEPGHYVPAPGSAVSIPCAPGYFQNLIGMYTCFEAAPGQYAPGLGTVQPQLCPPGTYQPLPGQASCNPAPVDHYVDIAGATSATPCPPDTTTNGQVGQTSCTPVPPPLAPAFSYPGSLPNPATCLCLPPYMVQNQFTTQHWWARAAGGGPLQIDPIAIGVNSSESGTLTVRVYDASNVLIGTSSGPHPGMGSEVGLAPITVPAPAAGSLYRIAVQVSGGAPQARHYRMNLHGATLLGMNSPSQAQPEHDAARWVVNVAAGEAVDVRVDTGVEAGASSAVVNIYSPSGVLVATGGLGAAVGTAPVAESGQWIVEVIPDGHYLITRNSGADRGIYVDWRTWGQGDVTVAVTRNGNPNAIPVTIEVVDLLTNAVVATQPGVLDSAHFVKLPAGNYRVRITGPGGISATAVVTCDGVTPIVLDLPNLPPKAADDQATTSEDAAVVVTVLGNDSDTDGGTLSVASVTQGANGSVAVNGDGTVTYIPVANWSGTDTFTYTVSDGQGGSATATVTVTVTPVNDQPEAVDDTATTNEDTAVTVAVLGNDIDVDGDTLSVTGVTQGANGTVSVSGSQVTYTPAPNWSGTDSFTYTIVDGNGGTDTATVTVTVNAVNDLPTAVDDSASTAEDAAVAIAVLPNDSDPDGGTLSVASVSQGAHGSVAVNGDGTVTYTPAANWNGTDTFTYTVSDGQGGSATATVTVTVTPVNDQPDAVDDTATTNEDTATTVSVLGNDIDPDGDTLSVTGVTQGANGTVSVSGNQVTYTPAPNWSGTDTFTYTIVDGSGGTDTATVTVTVNAVNDLPTAADDSASTNAGSPVTVSVLTNDSDPDGGTLSVASTTSAANGTVVVNANGTVTYTPTDGFSGTDTFTYTASDGQGGTATATVTVTVIPVANASRMTGGGTIEQASSQGQSNSDDSCKGSHSSNDGDKSKASKGDRSSDSREDCTSGRPKDDDKSDSCKGSHSSNDEAKGQATGDSKSKDECSRDGDKKDDGKSKGKQSSNDDSRSRGSSSRDDSKSKRWTWGFEIRCDGSKANLEYQDHAGGNFHLESVTSVFCTDDPSVNPTPPRAGFDTLRLLGVGRWNGVSGHSVDATFVDAGEPGTNDTIVITIRNAGGTVVSTVSGRLTGGNHQAHR